MTIELSARRHFRLGETELQQQLAAILPPRVRDLLHIAMAAYVVDRLKKRNGQNDFNGPSRSMSFKTAVSEPDFWRCSEIANLVRQALELLSEDTWEIEYAYAPTGDKRQRYFDSAFPLNEQPILCLYSGGLDSAAGLAEMLSHRQDQRIAVTAQHQAGQRDLVAKQLRALREVFGKVIPSVMVRTTLRDPPRSSQQELTQRCRSFLFAAIAGAVAFESRASTIEVYENGVGVINLPPMSGMLTGARNTKGAHTEFMRLMSRLVSRVLERPVQYELCFRDKTKAELVQSLNVNETLVNLALKTVSCVHYPRRVAGPAKQCGVCPGCIGRRQALTAAGIRETGDRYEYDILGEATATNVIPLEALRHLKVAIMQVVDLLGIGRDAALPLEVRSHLYGTKIVTANGNPRPWLRVLERYRDEWLALISEGQRKGLKWAEWFGPIGSSLTDRSVA